MPGIARQLKITAQQQVLRADAATLLFPLVCGIAEAARFSAGFALADFAPPSHGVVAVDRDHHLLPRPPPRCLATPFWIGSALIDGGPAHSRESQCAGISLFQQFLISRSSFSSSTHTSDNASTGSSRTYGTPDTVDIIFRYVWTVSRFDDVRQLFDIDRPRAAGCRSPPVNEYRLI